MADDFEARELGRLVARGKIGMSFVNRRLGERLGELPPAERRQARRDLYREVNKGARDEGGTVIRDD